MATKDRTNKTSDMNFEKKGLINNTKLKTTNKIKETKQELK